MFSAVLAILKFVAVLAVVGFLFAYFIQYGVPLITFAFGFITAFVAQLPEWVAPFVFFSVGLAILSLVVRLL